MEKEKINTINTTYAVIAMVMTLVIGLFAGIAIGISMNSTESEAEVIAPVVEECVPTIETITETVTIEAESNLDLAVRAFMDAVEEEETEDGEDFNVLGNYNFDELSLKKVYDEYNVSVDGDITTVDFSVKLRFKEDDAKSMTTKYDVKVVFEDDEDTEVTAIEELK